MNKQEALQKIKELQEYINNCDKQPEPKKGQLWEHEGGTVVMIVGAAGSSANFKAVCIKGSYNGEYWCNTKTFGMNGIDVFKYIGMASNILKFNT